MNITTNFLDKNKYSRPGTKRNKTTKIAWHYVGNPGSSAKANRNYFNNAPNHKTSASSHYIIGLEGEIIYCVPENEIAYTTNSANSYSIGIEMCHPDSSGKFNSLTYNAAVELGVDLAKRYKLNPLTDFIRHYDVTKKCCPKYWVDNNSAWKKFKQDVNNKLKVDNTQSSSTATFKNGDYIFVPEIRKAVEEKQETIQAYVVGDTLKEVHFKLGDLTDAEREIILKGCLINYYKATKNN